MKIAWLSIAICFMTGCTSQNAYDRLRYHQEMDFQKMQGVDRG